MTPKVGSLVHITWVDSCASTGWQFGDTAGQLTRCESVGWVVRTTDDIVVLAGHKSLNTDEWGGIMSIPLVAVLKVIRLSIGTRRKK